MLTWMLYVFAVTLLLSGAALAAEHVARLRRARTRWIWAVAIVASLLVPTLIASVSIQVPSLTTPAISRKVIPVRELTSVQLVPLTWVHEHTANIAATHSENQVLQRLWITVSAGLLAALVLNGVQLGWRKRRWRTATVAGIFVYIGRDVGPAVVGFLRPRIVVPDWLLRAPPPRQLMVLTHEQCHLTGHDPQLLTVALFLLVLMPWNLPLWWQLHRLRCAIEVDCDARVLEGGLDIKGYGETLLDVSQRPSGYVGSVAAMSESRSFLEERITIMVRDPVKWGSLMTVAFGGLSIALLTIAGQVTPPNVGSFSGTQQAGLLAPEVLDQYVGFYVRGANLLFEVTRVGDHLAFRGWDLPSSKLTAIDAGKFAFVDGGSPLTFVRDAAGRVTGLDILYEGSPPFTISMPRVDASTARAIRANNERRARSQTPAPGSEAALRRLIEGILAGRPDYDGMTSWYAGLVRQAWPITRSAYSGRGAVRTLEFRRVDRNGADVYEVAQQGGVSVWTIFLDPNGLIADADDYLGPGG